MSNIAPKPASASIRAESPFVPVAWVSETAPGTFRKVTVDGRACIVANVDGAFCAVENVCSHEDHRLSDGCLGGYRIKCSLHGSRFILHTGAPMDDPADDPIATHRTEAIDGTVRFDPSRRAN